MWTVPHKPVRAELVEALPFPFNPLMAFWTYILHCNGGYFYTGHTDDLERRMAEHEAGEVAGFVRDHWPAKLVWSSDFATRYEALSAERQIKGWSRAKKLALIRGDWDRMSALAKGKDRASTSSARTERGNGGGNKLVSVRLHPHPDFISHALSAIEVDVWRGSDGRLGLHFYVLGSIDRLAVSPLVPSRRRDELWRGTCFEFFGHLAGSENYVEINAAPSSEWASYRFDSYRDGMAVAKDLIVEVRSHPVEDVLHMVVNVDLAPALASKEKWEVGLSAIIEELDGTKSYWALAHPPEGPPDFHHPDCFALTLPPPNIPQSSPRT